MLLIYLCLLIGSIWRGEGGNCTFTAIFNFGDSNSDTGGLVAAFPSQQPPNGDTFFHHPAGRFSDGRLVIDFICESMGLSLLSPYLQALGSNYRNGVNFASAGASVLLPSSSIPKGWLSPFYLQVQMNQFYHFKSQALASITQESGLDVPDLDAFEKALYTIDIGQNDFSAQLSSGISLQQAIQVFPEVVDAIGNALQGLYASGARYLLVMSLGPMGCYPATLANVQHNPSDLDANGCLVSYNQAVANFNTLLHKKCDLLQTQLFGSHLVFVDSNAIKYELWSNHSLYGFSYTTKSCCGAGGPYNYNLEVTCGQSKMVNGQIISATSCEDPSKYVSWDGVHFTESANRHVATHILSRNYFHPQFPLLSHMCPLFPN